MESAGGRSVGRAGEEPASRVEGDLALASSIGIKGRAGGGGGEDEDEDEDEEIGRAHV